jgi:hypothetical protein
LHRSREPRVGNAFVIVPDLHRDVIEIGVRPRVLGTVPGLPFGVLASFGFAACEKIRHQGMKSG